MLIIGEAGIGKSRLLQNFHQQIMGTHQLKRVPRLQDKSVAWKGKVPGPAPDDEGNCQLAERWTAKCPGRLEV